MGIVYESQIWAGCDNCGNWESTTHMKMDTYKKYLRKKGWRIGEVCLCPDCAERARTRKRNKEGE